MHEPIRRLRLIGRGHVQGVGLRPYVHRLATGLGHGGWVVNATGEVRIETSPGSDRRRGRRRAPQPHQPRRVPVRPRVDARHQRALAGAHIP